MSRHKLILSVLSRAFFFIWVPSLPRSIQARLDKLDDAISSGFRSRVVGIVGPTLNLTKLVPFFCLSFVLFFVFFPFHFETRSRRDDICNDAKA